MITTEKFGKHDTFDLLRGFETYIGEFAQIKDKILDGQYDVYESFVLYSMIRALKPQKILEIGTGTAKTTSIMSLAATKNTQEGYADYKIVTIDIYKRSYSLPNTEFVTCDSAFAAESIAFQLKLDFIPDFLFYDAEHHQMDNLSVVFGPGGEVRKGLDRGIPVHFHDIIIKESDFIIKRPPLIGDVCGSPESKLVLDEIATGAYDVIFNRELYPVYKKLFNCEVSQFNPSIYLQKTKPAVGASDTSNWERADYPDWSKMCKQKWNE